MSSHNVEVHVKPIDEGTMGFLDKLTKKARDIRREDTLSGEKALSGFLRGGPGGLVDLGFGVAKAGIAAIALEVIGETLDSLSSLWGKIADGKKPLMSIFDEMARGVPILGKFGGAIGDLAQRFVSGGRTLEEWNALQDEQQKRRNEQGQRVIDAEKAADNSIEEAQKALRDIFATPEQKEFYALADKSAESIKELNKQLYILGSDNRGDTAAAKEKLLQAALLQGQSFAAGYMEMVDKQDKKRAEEARRDFGNSARATFDARSTSRTAFADFMDQVGRKDVAEQLRTLDKYQTKIQEQALKISDPKLSAEARSAILSAIASLSATQSAELERLRNPGVSFTPRAIDGGQDRFGRGVNEAFLTRSAITDTAKNTSDMLREQQRLNSILEKAAQTLSGLELTINVLKALGNG